MILESLRLENFKNYKNCSLNFSPKLNFIYGNNGNGNNGNHGDGNNGNHGTGNNGNGHGHGKT